MIIKIDTKFNWLKNKKTTKPTRGTFLCLRRTGKPDEQLGRRPCPQRTAPPTRARPHVHLPTHQSPLLRSGDAFLSYNTKGMKEMTDKLDAIKIKNFCSVKDPAQREKTPTRRKHLYI